MSNSTVALPEQSIDEYTTNTDGTLLLRVAGVLCILFGISEILSAVSVLGLTYWGTLLPWFDVTLSSGATITYVPNLAIALSLSYIVLGALGVLFSKNTAMAKKLTIMCAGTFFFHLVALVASFTGSNSFSFLSIFLIVLPVLFFLGAAQNTNNRKLSNTAIAYSFIAPNLIGFSIFSLIPMIFAMALSFAQWNLATNEITFVGFDNFIRLWSDHLFGPSVFNTIYFTALTVPLTMVLSLSLALLLNQKIRGRAIFRGAMFFPHVAATIAMAAVWNQLFHPSWGPINYLITSMTGMDRGPQWTTAPWIIPNIALFTAWRNMGYYMIIYLAGLQSIPTELYEAASIDGANKWQKFWSITLPQLRFVTFFVSIMLIIMSFRVYDQVLMITNTETPGSSATMLVVHIFRAAFVNWDFGYASAISMVLLVLVMSITITQFLIQKRIDSN